MTVSSSSMSSTSSSRSCANGPGASLVSCSEGCTGASLGCTIRSAFWKVIRTGALPPSRSSSSPSTSPSSTSSSTSCWTTSLVALTCSLCSFSKSAFSVLMLGVDVTVVNPRSSINFSCLISTMASAGDFDPGSSSGVVLTGKSKFNPPSPLGFLPCPYPCPWTRLSLSSAGLL